MFEARAAQDPGAGAGTSRGGPERVALKIVRPGVDVRGEARLGGLLRHVHLVDVYEVGEHDGVWFLAMELCRDGSLATRVPLPPRAVVDVGVAVARALAYAHTELGLVHLDLKPQNLLLDAGLVKVADLGVARTGDHERGRIVGTPGYMAPEVRAGGPVDGRADIWSLGVVLQELASGRRPGAATTASLGLDEPSWAQPPEPIDELAWLEPVLTRCLADAPDDRFPRMEDVESALRRLDAPGPPLARSLGAGARDRTVASRIEPTGRTRLLASLAELLERPGLVTLRGPAGIGKTVVAVEAARQRRVRTRSSAFVVELEVARDAADLVGAVAEVLEVPLRSGDPADHARRLGHALGARGDVMLVLDCFEHLLAERGMVATLRELAPRARLLVTSRQALDLAEERAVEVEPLAPDDAAALVVRAAARRGVVLDPADPSVGELARRLEGVPLALELAAGRLGVLGVDDVLRHLSLAFLRGRRAGTEDRGATLEGALTWSWELLDPGERATLAQLSVFRGGCTREAAGAVVHLPRGDDRSVEQVIDALSRRSLLGWRSGRLRLLEVVREFAAAQLDDDGSAGSRHAAFYARPGLVPGPWAPAERHARLLPDLDNLVAATERARASGDGELAAGAALGAWSVYKVAGPFEPGLALLRSVADLAPPNVAAAVQQQLVRALDAVGRGEEAVALATELVANAPLPSQDAASLQLLGSVQLTSGRHAEARRNLEAALAVPGVDPLTRGGALDALGVLHVEQGRRDEARALFEAAHEACRAAGDRLEEADALAHLGMVHAEQGRMEVAERHLEAALALHRSSGHRRGEGITLMNLANVVRARGRVGTARELYEAALTTQREIGDRRFEGVVLGNLALLDLVQGRMEEAEAGFERCRAIAAEVGNPRSEGIAHVNLGLVCAETGRWPEALDHYGRALELHRALGNRRVEAVALARRGAAFVELGDPEAARSDLDQAATLARVLGDPEVTGTCCAWLAELARQARDLAGAAEALAEGEAMLRALGATEPLGQLLCLLARLQVDQGALEAAARTIAEADGFARTLGAGPTSPLGRRVADATSRLEKAQDGAHPLAEPS